MAHIQKRTRNGKPAYVARYLDPEGQEHSRSFRTEREAERFLTQVEAAKLNGSYLFGRGPTSCLHAQAARPTAGLRLARRSGRPPGAGRHRAASGGAVRAAPGAGRSRASTPGGHDRPLRRWPVRSRRRASAKSTAGIRSIPLAGVVEDLRGPHDLRRAFATWLEDDGIPARVIDELMGHAATRRSSWAADGMSAMGAVYRHTTTEMEARVLKALDTRLALVIEVVESTRLTGQ